MKVVDKCTYEFKKGHNGTLDSIYEIQGLIPSGFYVSEIEYCDMHDIDYQDFDGVYEGLGASDDGVIFLKDVEITYTVKAKEQTNDA